MIGCLFFTLSFAIKLLKVNKIIACNIRNATHAYNKFLGSYLQKPKADVVCTSYFKRTILYTRKNK
jgi:hypothetical protein